MQDVVGFQCSRCVASANDTTRTAEKQNIKLAEDATLECVNKFCYLGDMIGAGGGAEEASRNRVRCAWSKFRELSPILTFRGNSHRLKEKMYSPCIQKVMVYDSETWAMKVEDMERL